MPLVERKIISGDLIEISQHWVARAPSSLESEERREREKLSSEAQEKLNDRAAWKKLVRLIRCNFRGEAGDQVITLTCRDRVTEEEHRRMLKLFRRKLIRYRERNGLGALKYICVTEQQGGRWHSHLILNHLPEEVITQAWEYGRSWISRLDDRDITGPEQLAGYLLQQHKTKRGTHPGAGDANNKTPRERGRKRWSCSRNLTHPVVEYREIKRVPRTPPIPKKGYRLLPGWEIGCDMFGNLFRRWSLLKEEPPAASGAGHRKSQKKKE